MNQQPLAILELKLTPCMIKRFKQEPFNLEIEMLQASQKQLPDGRTEFIIEIFDEEKAQMIKDFVLQLISNSHNACKN